MNDTIDLYRKFGLHASADALQAKLTCRTCAHLDTDPKEAPCAGCREFERWQDARADGAAAPVGGEVEHSPILDLMGKCKCPRCAASVLEAQPQGEK